MTRSLKLLISVLLIFVLSSMPIIAGAATATSLPSYFSGNVDFLIDIRNPETIVSNTTNRTCVISAVAVKGTKVALYALNYATGSYEILRNSWGGVMESTVGASGLYVQQITLKDGLNSIMVVGTSPSGACESVRLEISLLNQGYMNNVNGNFKSNGIGVIDIFN